MNRPSSRRPRLALAAVVGACGLSLTAGLSLSFGQGGDPPLPGRTSYPAMTGGEWSRGPNLKDAKGNFQARQEHAAVELNGFVYLIGGFVPNPEAAKPTENEPEPFPFMPTGEIQVYTPSGHPTAPVAKQGRWSLLPKASSFPRSDKHHILAVNRGGSGPSAVTPASSLPRPRCLSSARPARARPRASGARRASATGQPASATDVTA